MTAEYLQNKIAQNAELTKCREDIERKVIEGVITPTVAAKAVIGSMERLLFTGTNET